MRQTFSHLKPFSCLVSPFSEALTKSIVIKGFLFALQTLQFQIIGGGGRVLIKAGKVQQIT